LMPDASEDRLRRVRAGLLASPLTVNAVREYCGPRFGWLSPLETARS